MSKVIENYILNEVIGSGSYGKVYRASNMKTDEIVAVKVISLEKFIEVPKLTEFTMNEIQTLSKIENIHIVKFLEMLKTSNNMYLIYEFCSGGTLESEINKHKFLPEQTAMSYLSQMLVAFKTLTKFQILHRDLKPTNILFHNNILKIADFGFCKSLSTPQDMTRTMVGSPIYMAPEILKGENYNTQADVWSLGVVFFECLFGFCPYEDRSIAKLIGQIDNKELQIPRHINNISQKTEEILRSMLVVDWRKRIEWKQLFSLIDDQGDLGQKLPLKPLNDINNVVGAKGQQQQQQQYVNRQNNHFQSIQQQNQMQKYGNSFKPSVEKQNRERSFNKMNQQNPVMQQQQFSMSFKENKQLINPQNSNSNQNNAFILSELSHQKFLLNFGVNILYNILDLYISKQTPIVGYLIIQQIWQYSQKIQNFLEYTQQQKGDFKNSIEQKYFWEILNKEKLIIKNTLEYFKAAILKLGKKNPDLQETVSMINDPHLSCLSNSYCQNQFMLYLEEVIQKSSDSKTQIMIQQQQQHQMQLQQGLDKQLYSSRRLEIHQNEILDFLINFNIQEDMPLKKHNINQNYQIDIQNLSDNQLQETIAQKFSSFKEKCLKEQHQNIHVL